MNKRKGLYILAVAVIALFAFAIVNGIKSQQRTVPTRASTTASTTAFTTVQTTQGTTSRPSAPYVGMSESRIRSTGLGSPSDKVRHNNQVKNGKQYVANLYDFYRDGQRVFTARCVRGTVTEIWDYRDDPVTTTKKARRSTGKQSTTADPYDAKNYSNEEDFYDDHYDDFMDYYEAEDYYNEHHG